MVEKNKIKIMVDGLGHFSGDRGAIILYIKTMDVNKLSTKFPKL